MTVVVGIFRYNFILFENDVRPSSRRKESYIPFNSKLKNNFKKRKTTTF